MNHYKFLENSKQKLLLNKYKKMKYMFVGMWVCLKTSAVISLQCRLKIEKSSTHKSKLQKVAINRSKTKRKQKQQQGYQQQPRNEKGISRMNEFFICVIDAFTPEGCNENIEMIILHSGGNDTATYYVIKPLDEWKCRNCENARIARMGNGQMKAEGKLATK